MKVSDKGLAFLAGHEGVVTRTYLDPAGIVTIGIGFTMRSAVFAEYWRKKRGHSLRLGDTMTVAECHEVLRALLDQEYGAAVARKFGDRLEQYQFDAVSSVVFNCGAATLNDRWGVALAKGQVAEAARLLRSTRITAKGKRLQGLVNRRAEEATLLEFGNYGAGVKTRSSRYDLIVEAQQLLVLLGYDPGPADGIEGDRTRGATLAYQESKPDLVDDGIIGPATVASLRRDVAALPAAPAVEPTPAHPDADLDDEPAAPPTLRQILKGLGGADRLD
jgi:GH24 family phage-related lysozyme (muramidase)